MRETCLAKSSCSTTLSLYGLRANALDPPLNPPTVRLSVFFSLKTTEVRKVEVPQKNDLLILFRVTKTQTKIPLYPGAYLGIDASPHPCSLETLTLQQIHLNLRKVVLSVCLTVFSQRISHILRSNVSYGNLAIFWSGFLGVGSSTRIGSERLTSLTFGAYLQS